MEYGDLSSLAVEYPDYNSLGKIIIPIVDISVPRISNKAVKITELKTIPKGVSDFSDLAGRAIIVTKNKDLVAFGILVNESN